MTEREAKISTAGSERIPQRRSEGVAGPSREVSQRDHEPSGAGGAGRENEELRWAQNHVPDEGGEDRPIRSVFRKTELHYAAPVSCRDTGTRRRRQVKRSPGNPGSGVTLRPLETAIRDVVCSLLDRQDLMERHFLEHAADLQQQIDALERRLREARPALSGEPEVRT